MDDELKKESSDPKKPGISSDAIKAEANISLKNSNNTASKKPDDNNFKSLAIDLLSIGINSLPCNNKAPAAGIISWAVAQNEPITLEIIERWFSLEHTQIAIACGKGSENLECIDFDKKNYKPGQDVFEEYCDIVKNQFPDLFNRLVIERSISGGYHIYYRCEEIEGNQVLAKWQDGEIDILDSKGNKTGRTKAVYKAPIETRGQGGFVVSDPSPGYLLTQNTLFDIPNISIDERDFLLSAARSFDDMPEPEEKSNSKINKPEFKWHGISPFDDYNEKVNPIELMEKHGWTIVDNIRGNKDLIYLKRPGDSKAKHSANYSISKKRLRVWSNATEFVTQKKNSAGEIYEVAYSPSGIYTMLEWQGDYKKAFWALYELGYGTRKPDGDQTNKPAKEMDEPIPLLPIEGLPDFLQKLIIECSKVYGTHQDFWAGSFLAATSLAIGQSHQLKGKYINGPVLWLAIVGQSGIGKTEPLSFAFGPFHKLDEKTIMEFEENMKAYEILKKAKGSKNNTDPLPDPPKCKQLILSDVTPEAVMEACKNNIRGINILRDELHGWINDFGRYNKSGEVQNWLSSWSQKSMTVNRKTGIPIKVQHPFINITGGIQTGILPELAKDFRAINGFMHRICFVFPDDVIRSFYNNSSLPERAIEQYIEYITNLLSLKGHCEEVNLSFDAHIIYESFANTNTNLINNEKNDYKRAIYSKLDIICLRFALIIHFSKWACTTIKEPAIIPETMKAAIDITEYFRVTGLKVYRHLKIENSELNLKTVATYLKELGASQNEIAAALKVSQPYINKILNGK